MTTSEPQPLFPPSLISESITSTLPAPYKIRPLERNDYEKGFLDCLRVLTHVGDVSQERFNERYDWMTEQAKGGYYFLVIEDLNEGKIVGTGALILERKFIHDLGIIGHIEEIAVRKEHQGKKLGIAMIKALDSVAVNVGCYKTILNCGERNEGFYLKCGYRKAALEMVHYYEEEKSAYGRG